MRERTLYEHELDRYEHAMGFMRYVNRFNMLERSIGYCIRCLNRTDGASTSDRSLFGLSFMKKLEKLKQTVDRKGLLENREFVAAFNEWIAAADRSRAIRNDYIHGDWDIVLNLAKPIRFTPMQWTAEESSPTTQSMSMSEFLAAADEMDALADSFTRLREKYIG